MRLLVLFGCCAVLMLSLPAFAETYYVAPDGQNNDDGSRGTPWETLRHAIGEVRGGDTIILMDGTYDAATNTSRAFPDWVTIRAEHPYRAKLTNVTNGGPAIAIYTVGSAKIIIEDFLISNTHPSHSCSGRESHYLIHLQDANDVTIRNNIIFGNNAPGTCNELLKINRGGDNYVKDIRIEGNVFYDHANAAGADMIDSVRPGELDIVGNIFFARNAPDAQSFITLKRQVDPASVGVQPRSPRYRVSRNVFLNWNGRGDQAFIQFGEDTQDQYMITDAVIENNLFLGNASNNIAGAIQLKGTRGITVRANTIVGDLPGGSFGLRIGTEGSNPQVQDISIKNNIWSDPTGTMGNRFINTYGDVDVGSIVLDNNLYFNDGSPLPTQSTPAPENDQNGVVADPELANEPFNIELPVWDETTHRFPSGRLTIRAEFERLVHTYGAFGASSPAIGAADETAMPPEDILGRARDGDPDIGAFEHLSSTLADAGTMDTGVADVPLFDAGVGEDATHSDSDATVNVDSSVADGGTPTDTDEGCGCSDLEDGLSWRSLRDLIVRYLLR